MKRFLITVTITSMAYTSCYNQTPKGKTLTTAGGISYVKLTPIAAKSSSRSSYTGYEVKDPGIRNISAIIFQIPAGWQTQSSLTRIWNGSTPINQLYLKTGDATTTLEILPYAPYYYADGPTTRSLRQTSLSMGYPQQYQPFELPPMDPLTYIRQVLLPRLQKSGIRFEVTGSQDLGYQNQIARIPNTRHGYIDGRLSDGRSVRIECGISVTVNNVGGESYYNWSAFPAVITSNGSAEAGYAVLKHIRLTTLYNPEWEQECNMLTRKGNAANAAIAQKDYENIRNYREAVNNIHKGVADARNESAARNNESFRDMIGGQAKFENPGNGRRVSLDDKYQYYYTDDKGNYYGSHEPVDFKAMGWTEINRLDTKDY